MSEEQAEPAHPSTARRGRARVASVVAQAKINLYLRVLAREADGFHQIETLFQRLALGDQVRVSVGGATRGRALDCRGADVGPVEHNLAWRAALAYAAATGWPDAFAIEVDKLIPTGSGLGGGSADAGAVLRGLNALAPEPLGAGALLALAAPLGADVPFLTSDAPLALAWGRGERMLALRPLPGRRVHLALFAEGVATGPAYAALAEWRARHAARPRPVLWTPERLTTWDDVALVASNDFEQVVLPAREDVASVRQLFADVAREMDAINATHEGPDADGTTRPPLRRGDRVPFALMSGSGATVFLLSPRSGVSVDLAVRGPDEHDDAEPSPDAPVRVVVTETVTRVARVSVRG